MMTGTTEVSFQSARPAKTGTAAAFDTLDRPDHGLQGRQIDSDPQLMEESHRLRYQVYCIERGFLNPDDYPDHCEIDEFDRHSLHLGVTDGVGTLLATARLVKANVAGFPLFRHCQIYRGESELYQETIRLAEISRLCISRALRRRRIGSTSVAIQLYRAIYQASKRNGFTHWLVATEPSLQRLLASLRVPFRAVGPVTDYYGPVAPYLIDLRKWDEVIVSRSMPALHSFLDGLEPEFKPAASLVMM
jgi:N-acyl-L-homoserine lactone synthetase